MAGIQAQWNGEIQLIKHDGTARLQKSTFLSAQLRIDKNDIPVQGSERRIELVRSHEMLA